MSETPTPEERRVLDRLAQLIESGKLAVGRIRPLEVTALNTSVDPPTVDLRIVGTSKVLSGRRFFCGTPLATGMLVYAWQEGGDIFVLGAPTSINNSGWRYVGNSGQPAFQNDWANYSAANQTLGFRRVGDDVQLRGQIKSNGAGALNTSTVFTLPVGFRPRFAETFAGFLGDFAVYDTGIVQYLGANNPVQVGLATIRFSVA